MLEKPVDERGLAVVDVGNDRDVAQGHECSPKKGASQRPRPIQFPDAPTARREACLRRYIVTGAVNANDS